jgi:hypothetical protein
MNRAPGATSLGAIAIVLAACAEISPSGPDDNPSLNAPSGIVVSNALTPRVTSSATGVTGSLSAQAATVAYLSAVPGTFPGAVLVSVSNKTKPAPAQTARVVDGGFDPISVEGQSGDELSLTFSAAAGGITAMSVKVPPRRPPTVVRTSPAKGRTDVAMNSYMVVIFSEPIEASSVTSSSLTLTRDGIPVKGGIQVSTDRLSAEFIPDNPLEPQRNYEFRIDGAIRDLDGDPLGEAAVVTFATSVSATAGAIEVSVSTSGPDQDADGYILSAQAPSTYQWARLGVTGTQTIAGTEPGDVSVFLYGLATNCTIAGPNERILNVQAGVTAKVSFFVICVASGSLRVTTVTTGTDPDIDGYSMFDRDRSAIGSDLSHSFTAGLDIGLRPNATTTVRALVPGSYQVAIQNVAPNCDTPIAAAETITIVAGVETSLTLEFTCGRSTQIAFVRGAGHEEWEPANIAKTDIYLINSNGTGTVRLTSEAGADINPAWSPDGIRIAFRSQRIGSTWRVNLYVMNDDGSGATPLTNSTAYTEPGAPAWSPDGRTIAFGSGDMYLMNADGSEIRRFLSGGTSIGSPDWSPDGRNIAFDDRDCWNFGPCPRGIVIGTIDERYSIVIDDASEPAWRPR